MPRAARSESARPAFAGLSRSGTTRPKDGHRELPRTCHERAHARCHSAPWMKRFRPFWRSIALYLIVLAALAWFLSAMHGKENCHYNVNFSPRLVCTEKADAD